MGNTQHKLSLTGGVLLLAVAVFVGILPTDFIANAATVIGQSKFSSYSASRQADFASYTTHRRALVTDPRFIDSRNPLPHNQATSTITGLDTALSAASSHIGNSSNPHTTTASQTGAEPHLGSPDTDGKVLASTAMGVRLWVDPPVATHSAIVEKINETPADDTLPLLYKKADGTDVFNIDLATGTVTITGTLVIK